MKINKNAVLRYAVPFCFEASADYGVLCKTLEADNERWTPEAWTNVERDTFEYLYRSLFYENDNCHIGSGWRYSLAKAPLHLRYYPDEEQREISYSFSVKTMGLYIFRTNVGVLWYEITLPKKNGREENKLLDASVLVDFQNRFKELNYRRNKNFTVVSPLGEEKTLVMGDVIDGLLKSLSSDIHYLNGTRESDDGGERPDKALIFNYVLTEGQGYDEDELHRSSYALANGYNYRYRMAKSVKEDFIEPFDKACWYASRGGCGYFAYVDEAEDNSFFRRVLPKRIRGDYFFMYILVLYQTYSILNYLRRLMQYYPADPKKYFEPEQAEELDIFTAEINTFLMKGMYSSVSNVNHHNVFFQYLQKRLSVKEDIESITMGVNAMAKVQRVYKEKEETRLKAEEEKREARHGSQLNLILTVISLLSVFSALVDMHEFMNRIELIGTDGGYVKGIWKLLTNGDVLTYLQLFVGLAVIGLSVACVVILIKNCLENRKSKQK